MLEKDPLRIQLDKDDEALQARVISMSRRQLDVAFKIDPDEPTSVRIDFSFLDTMDGAIVELIHRGPSKPAVIGILPGADIRDVGSASLGTETLKAAAQTSRIRRFFASRPKFEMITPFAIILASFVVFYAFIISGSQYQSSHVIDIKQYNLNTIKGQVAFANAVANTKAFNGSSIVFSEIFGGILCFIFFCVGAYMLLPLFRRKVPWKIAEYQIEIRETKDHSEDGLDESVEPPAP